MKLKAFLFIISSISFIYHSLGKSCISQEYDSIGIKTIVTRTNYRLRENHTVDVYLDNIVYQFDTYIYKDTIGDVREKYLIYLPDTLKPNNKIKVTVHTNNYEGTPRILRVQSKTYRFKFIESKNAIIHINYKKERRLFRRKSHGCCGNFW